MVTAQEIQNQQQLLTTYRQQLAHYLKQQATFGTASTPQEVRDGIGETRANIERVKSILRAWGALMPKHNAPGAIQGHYPSRFKWASHPIRHNS